MLQFGRSENTCRKGKSSAMNELEIEAIYKKNIGLVWHQLHKFKRGSDVDAQSFANEALYRAIKTYDADKGSSFATYASVCIFNAIGSYTRKGMNAEKPLSIHTELHENLTLEDMLPDTTNIESEYIANDRTELITRFLKAHAEAENTPARRQSLEIWIEADFEITQQEIADIVGCSQAYVARVIRHARDQLKLALEGVLA